MTTQDAPISTPPTLRIEQLFVAMLQEDPTLAGLTIVAASDRSVVVPPLHCFVYCQSVKPVLSFGQNYRADITIVVATNIDDQTNAERTSWFSKVLKALTKREGVYTNSGDILLGWPLGEINEVSTDQQTGDAVRINAAATVGG